MVVTDLNGRLRQIVDELVVRGVTLEQARREFERQFIVSSLQSNGLNVGRSADALGVHRNTLRNKAESLGVAIDELRAARRRSRRQDSGTDLA
ncbi:MAG TPA: helix-turn-helix domain-containing protein [Thermoanaerobaculia bacterium]|jgi:DNA-binding NtrC family response regulator|nr:helix-turn-helix domain-containing protein [Thermoanaerobaculia bacterium]